MSPTAAISPMAAVSLITGISLIAAASPTAANGCHAIGIVTYKMQFDSEICAIYTLQTSQPRGSYKASQPLQGTERGQRVRYRVHSPRAQLASPRLVSPRGHLWVCGEFLSLPFTEQICEFLIFQGIWDSSGSGSGTTVFWLARWAVLAFSISIKYSSILGWSLTKVKVFMPIKAPFGCSFSFGLEVSGSRVSIPGSMGLEFRVSEHSSFVFSCIEVFSYRVWISEYWGHISLGDNISSSGVSVSGVWISGSGASISGSLDLGGRISGHQIGSFFASGSLIQISP